MISREEAINLLKEKGVSSSLMRHCLATEAVMRAMALKFEEDEELWGLTGLLHDVDFPQTEANPAEHGLKGAEWLKGKLPDNALAAIRTHNGEMNGVMPSEKFDYALRCGETVTGIIAAASLMRPTGYEGMSVKSIKKKMKDKAFAANVNRANIMQCTEAGLDLDEFLNLSISAMAAQHNS